jgi:hypothetical protein
MTDLDCTTLEMELITAQYATGEYQTKPTSA